MKSFCRGSTTPLLAAWISNLPIQWQEGPFHSKSTLQEKFLRKNKDTNRLYSVALRWSIFFLFFHLQESWSTPYGVFCMVLLLSFAFVYARLSHCITSPRSTLWSCSPSRVLLQSHRKTQYVSLCSFFLYCHITLDRLPPSLSPSLGSIDNVDPQSNLHVF